MTKKQAKFILEQLKDLQLKHAESMKKFALAPNRTKDMKGVALMLGQTYADTALILKEVINELRDAKTTT